jgi:uncharacterized protein (TIGR02284 family)
MRMNRSDIVDLINDLIETCQDGEHGFAVGASLLDSDELSILFMLRSGGCERAASELQTFLIQYHGKPRSPAHLDAARRHRWNTRRNALADQGDDAVISEWEQLEDETLARYQEALETEDLPTALRTCIEKQFHAVRRSHQQVHSLRDRWRATA